MIVFNTLYGVVRLSDYFFLCIWRQRLKFSMVAHSPNDDGGLCAPDKVGQFLF